jgi:pectate lyase
VVAPSVGTRLAFATQPANTTVGATMAAIVVQIQDANGVAVASNNVPVTLGLTTGPGTLTGTMTRNTDATGKATFNDMSINAVGTGDQLTASASGIGAGLANAVSAPFNITDVPPAALQITSQVMTPAGFVVSGANNTPNVFCQILGAADVGTDATNWMIVSYQNFDATAHVTFTNPVSPALPTAVYRLRTGDTTTKTQPPSIGIPPVSQIVSAGATAVFTVTASSPSLQYLWFFNGAAIAGATTSALTIPNAQAANAGNYYVAVANPAGFVNSPVVTLAIGNVAPAITAQPAGQTVTGGGTAVFNAAASGTSPLSYQWYYNNSIVLPGKTTTQLIVNPVSTNDAGLYSLNVSNAFGQARSTNATLAVSAVPSAPPQTNLVGFAAVAGVTGGAGGAEVYATNYAALRAYCRAAGPIIIHVPGPLVANESYTYIEGFDKTILGDGTNAALYGDFRPSGTNIIIANMYLSATNSNSDGVTIDGNGHGTGRNVWVDHCTFFACSDGSLDVTKGADYVTVSWCKFSYEPVPDGVVNHEFVNLIGSSDSDNLVNFHVTFHHNWYGDYARERMPSVRFGRVHVFNNYYNCVGNNYCVRTRINAQVLVENNYYVGVQNPWERFVTSGSDGLLKATGNITNSCRLVSGWTSGAVVIPGTDTLTDPTLTTGIYPYTLDAASDVPYYVETYAGSGKYPYVP